MNIHDLNLNEYISVPYIEVVQPVGTFYIASMDFRDVLSIAHADVRRKDKGKLYEYMGIQREVKEGRRKEIASYCTTIDATFPTGIILSIDSLDENGEDNKNIYFNDNRLYIKKAEKVATILDGQHRLEGLQKAINELENTPFQLNVVIFVDIEIDGQAQIFSVINKAQTKVNKSLVYDLYEFSKIRCPQKTAHDIACILNKKEESPFYKKIKILGKVDEANTETIAQATFVERVMKYISKDPMKDRDILNRKRFFGKAKLTPANEIESRDMIFRNMFIEDADYKIVQIIYDFFCCVRDKWPSSWNENKDDNVLNKSTGIIALIRFLRDVYVKALDEKIPFHDYCEKIFERIDIKDNAFSKSTYLPGTSGQQKLYKELCESLKKPFSK